MNQRVHQRWLLALLAAAVVGGAMWMRFGLVTPRPAIDPTHIVLISIDTCRADHLGCYGYSPSATPHLDALAREGVLLENVASPVPLTLPSHSTMLTGTIPPYHAVRDNTDYYLDEVYVTLPEILQEQGYVTGAIISAFVLDSRFGLDQGFDQYDDQFDDAANLAGMLERRGGEVTDHAIDWLQRHRGGKGFLFLHYFDPHKEYDPPGPWAARYADRPYLGEIAYTDDCIGRVVQKLKELGIYDSTLLMVTSDHGEMLGEHGEMTHSYFIYQGVVRVPLIVKLPRAASVAAGGARAAGARRISAMAGLVDITPTICGLLGLEIPAPIQGVDLSPWLRGAEPENPDRPQYCESITPTKYQANPLFGLVTSRWKFIHSTRDELYDLRADPGETNNLVDEHPDRTMELLSRLQEMLQVNQPNTAGDRSIWDEQAARRLTSLGYVGGAARTSDFSVNSARGDAREMMVVHGATMQVNGHLKHKEFAEARKICAEIVRRHPTVAEGHSLMGRIAMGERKYEEAVKHWNSSLIIRDDPIAYNRLALAYWELGNVEEAVRSVRGALDMQAEFPEAQGNLGRFLVHQGHLDAGIAFLKKAVELKSDFGVAHLALADALFKQKEFRESAIHYQRAIELGIEIADAHFRLAGIRRLENRPREAIAHYRQAIEAREDFAAARFELGNMLQSRGELATALIHYRRALALDPDSVSLMNNVAWILATHPDPEVRQGEEALQIAERAAEATDRADASVLDTLAAAQANAGQFDKAAETVRTALSLLTSPNHEALRKQLSERLELYQRGEAYRESSE